MYNKSSLLLINVHSVSDLFYDKNGECGVSVNELLKDYSYLKIIEWKLLALTAASIQES